MHKAYLKLNRARTNATHFSPEPRPPPHTSEKEIHLFLSTWDCPMSEGQSGWSYKVRKQVQRNWSSLCKAHKPSSTRVWVIGNTEGEKSGAIQLVGLFPELSRLPLGHQTIMKEHKETPLCFYLAEVHVRFWWKEELTCTLHHLWSIQTLSDIGMLSQRQVPVHTVTIPVLLC